MTENNSVEASGTGQSNEQGSAPEEKPWQQVLSELGPGKSRSEGQETGQGGDEAGDKGSRGDVSGTTGEGAAGAGEAGDGGGEVKLDKETLSAMFTEAVKAAQPPPPPKQYTEEELRQALNIFQASDSHLKQLGLEATPEKVEALNTILQAVAKQATSVATFELKAAIDAITERIKPVFQHMEQSRMDNMKQRFFSKHKDLEGLEPIVVVAHQNLKARGVKFGAEDEAFKAVAEETRAILSKLPGYKDGKRTETRTETKKTQPTPSRRMPTLSSGGQGGAGDKSGQPSGPKWKSVFREG
jgi:hypothetical protein